MSEQFKASPLISSHLSCCQLLGIVRGRLLSISAHGWSHHIIPPQVSDKARRRRLKSPLFLNAPQGPQSWTNKGDATWMTDNTSLNWNSGAHYDTPALFKHIHIWTSLSHHRANSSELSVFSIPHWLEMMGTAAVGYNKAKSKGWLIYGKYMTNMCITNFNLSALAPCMF